MGSSVSKRRKTARAGVHPKSRSAASSRNSTLSKKARRGEGPDLSASVPDNGLAATDVSMLPNGKLHNGEVRANGHVHNGKYGHMTDAASLPDITNVNGDVTSGKTLTPVNTLSRKNKHGDKHQSLKHAKSDSRLLAGEDQLEGQADSDQLDTHSNYSTGLRDPDYNGGSGLPRSDQCQNVVSRIVKNGIGGGRKSALQQLWKASEDEYRKKLSHLCDVTMVTGDLVAVSRSEVGRPGLQLFSLGEGGRPGQILGESFLPAPRGVCCYRDTIAVTDWDVKTVNFMDTNGNFVGSWKQNKFQHPGGIAVNRQGRYVVADLQRHEEALGLYSPYGKLFRRFGSTTFDWPWYVVVDRMNRILVSDKKSSTVSVFDEDGRYLFQFGGQGSLGGGSGRSGSPRAEEALCSPGGLAVDASNHILVADTDNYRVALFSPDGLYVKTLVTTSFSRPVSVSFDDGHVGMITDSDLRVYKTYSEKTSL